MSDDIQIDIEKSASDDEQSGSTGNSGGGNTRRSAISVQEEYGTSFYGADTECKKCDTRAVGVLIMPDKIVPESAVCRSVPLCRNHRDQTMDQFGTAWTASEFLRFVDA